jgi:photosystem II stability/assembly factor-like uncharacterized protein
MSVQGGIMRKLSFSAPRKFLNVSILVLILFLFQSCDESTVVPKLKSHPQSEWQQMNSGTSENLRDVWGIDGEHVFAVGDNGAILYFNGAEWNRMNSGTDNNLLAIWGCGMQDIFVTGENGTILHFDGLRWEPITIGTTESIKAIWGPVDEECITRGVTAYALVEGSPGMVMKYDYWSGEFNNWRALPSEPSTEFLNILGFQSSDALVEMCLVGRGGAAYFLDYNGWRETETGTTDDLFAVLGDAPSNVYAIASNGNIYQNTKRWLEDPPTRTWRQVAGLGGGKLFDIAARSYNDIFIVGASGRIVHYDRQTFTRMKSNAFSTIWGIWADDTDVFAVGDDGLILTYSDPPSKSPCPINVTISVTDDIMPIISWSPECPVSKLFVEDWGENGYDLSWFIADDGNLIETDVQYGTVPDNAIEFCPTGALMEGELYRVSMIRRDWDNELLIGSWNFIPSDSQLNGFMTVSQAEIRGADDWLAQASADPQGFQFKKFFLPRIRQIVPGQNIFSWAGVRIRDIGSWRWVGDPGEREDYLNIRHVIMEKIVINPDTGLLEVISVDYYRAADPIYDSSETVVWDIVRR